MSQRKAIHPELYSVEPADAPRLIGGRCNACGYVFFPPQSYGCESCGAPPDKLERIELPGRGRLHSFATVHLYQGKGIEAPFTVGVIVLDDGPALRAILTERTGAGVAIGDPMRAILAPQGSDDAGNELVELRFERAEAAK
jgi:uncharacterized OB-fold protein